MVCCIQITQSRQVIEYIPQVHLLYRRASIVESMSIIVLGSIYVTTHQLRIHW